MWRAVAAEGFGGGHSELWPIQPCICPTAWVGFTVQRFRIQKDSSKGPSSGDGHADINLNPKLVAGMLVSKLESQGLLVGVLVGL